MREPQRPETAEDHVPTAALDDDPELEWDDEDEWDDEWDEDDGVYVAADDQPARLSERRKEKLAEKRRILIKRLGVVFGALVLIGVVVWLLFFSPLFRYTYAESDVVGLSEDSIVDVTEVGSVARSHNGEPVLLIDTGALESQIVSAVPEVAEATVTKSPPKSLTIELAEHTPIACIGEGECTVVADDGTELRVPEEAKVGLPRVSQIPDEMEPAEAIGDILSVLNALSPQIRDTVNHIDIAGNGIITFTLTDGRRVNWGVSDAENDFKAELIEALLAQQAWYYDVSVPRSPVTSN